MTKNVVPFKHLIFLRRWKSHYSFRCDTKKKMSSSSIINAAVWNLLWMAKTWLPNIWNYLPTHTNSLYAFVSFLFSKFRRPKKYFFSWDIYMVWPPVAEFHSHLLAPKSKNGSEVHPCTASAHLTLQFHEPTVLKLFCTWPII